MSSRIIKKILVNYGVSTQARKNWPAAMNWCEKFTIFSSSFFFLRCLTIVGLKSYFLLPRAISEDTQKIGVSVAALICFTLE